jgi:hypothetical protein
MRPGGLAPIRVGGWGWGGGDSRMRDGAELCARLSAALRMGSGAGGGGEAIGILLLLLLGDGEASSSSSPSFVSGSSNSSSATRCCCYGSTIKRSLSTISTRETGTSNTGMGGRRRGW